MTDCSVTRARLLVVALAFVGALIYGVLLPLGEAPDEPGHYNYARILAGEQRLPEAEEEHEAFQPPLYYALAAPLVGLGDVTRLPLLANPDFTLDAEGPSFLLVHTAEERFPYAGWAWGWHLQRLLSAGLGAITAYSLFQVGLLVSGGSVSAALLSAGALALMPQFSLVHGAATNDSLALTLGSLLVAQTAVAAVRPRARGKLVAVGVLWGLAILSKISLLAAGAGLAVALWTGRRGSRPAVRARETVLDLVAIGIGAAVVSGWWFVRNVALFGDPLAWDLVAATNAVRQGSVAWLADLWGLHRSYWLSYVGMRLPDWFYAAALVPVVMAWLGLGLALRGSPNPPTPLGCAQDRLFPEKEGGAGAPLPSQGRGWGRGSRLKLLTPVLLLYAAAFVVSWIRWALAVMGTDQARLLYPAAAAVVPLLAVGVVQLVPPRWRDRAGLLGVAALMAVNAYALGAGVLPVFGESPCVSVQAVPATSGPIRFGGKLELLGWEVPSEASVGEDARMHLWWRALEPLEYHTWLTVRLVDSSGQVVAWRRGTPDGGPYAPDCWEPGAVIAGRRFLPVPQGTPPGVYRVEIGVQPLGSEEWWPAVVSDGPPRDVWDLGEIEIRASG